MIHTRAMPSIALPAPDADNLRHAFDGLEDPQISKLLSAAEWKTASEDELITRQDAPVGHLFFIVKGGARVSTNGEQIALLGPGSFIGEIAYLTGNMATADVTADAGTRLLTFSRVRLARLAAEDKEIGTILNQLLGRDLAQKMRQTNTRRVLEAENLHH
jgi:CRP-like cAMP-binding protein